MPNISLMSDTFCFLFTQNIGNSYKREESGKRKGFLPCRFHANSLHVLSPSFFSPLDGGVSLSIGVQAVEIPTNVFLDENGEMVQVGWKTWKLEKKKSRTS